MKLVGGFKYFWNFHHYFGEDFQVDEYIFQMGWNHQPGNLNEFGSPI